MATIGLKDIYYAKIIKDDETGTTYDTPKKLAPAMSLTKTPAYNRSNLRADDGVIATVGAKGPTTIAVGITELSKEARKDILGSKINSDGGVVANRDDRPNDVAVLFRAEKSNGAYKYVCLYKVQFDPPAANLETKQETPSFQTPVLNGQAIPRLSDGNEDVDFDSDDEEVDISIFTNWFKQVYEETPEG